MGTRAALLLLIPLLLPAQNSTLLFTKTFGGSGAESATAIATDLNGNVILGGTTSSFDLPVTNSTRNTGTQFAVSTDHGNTWAALSNLSAGTPIALYAISGTWYAVSRSGLFQSTDAGATWQVVPAPSGLTNLTIDPAQRETLYAIVNAAIMKSTDAGATWNALPLPVQNPNPPGYLALDPFQPDHLFTSIGHNGYRSLDGGISWTPFSPPQLHPDNYCGSGGSPIAFDPVTRGVVYLADHCDLFVSTDGGANWSVLTTPFRLSFTPAADPVTSGTVYVTGDDGLYKTIDSGRTWNRLLPYDENEPPHVIAIDPSQPTIVIAGSAVSLDGGTTWSNLALGRPPNAVVFDPAVPGRIIAATDGAASAFLARFDAMGTFVSATYFGGSSATTIAGMATDSTGAIYITGATASPDFPATPVTGASAYAAKFDTSLNLVYATFLPAGTKAAGIAVDPQGRAAIAGTDYANTPATCFVSKLSVDGAGTIFFQPFGGTGGDSCSSVASDATGNTLIGGLTRSKDFPVTGAGAGTSLHGGRDAVLAEFDPVGALQYSAYLGGSDDDSASAVAFDSAGNLYVAGATSSADYPVTSGAYQSALSTNCGYPTGNVVLFGGGFLPVYNYSAAFVTKLDPSGRPLFSTYIGGGCNDSVSSMALGSTGEVWLAGNSDSDSFPQVQPFQSGPAFAAYKPVVAQLDSSGSVLRLSSFSDAGAVIASDPSGAAWLAGQSGSHIWIAKLQPQPAAPVEIQSVGNAFSMRNGPVSAGQITMVAAPGIAPAAPVDLTLTPAGPLPRTLAGIQVLFDGEAAPMLSVSAGRVVAVAPYDLAGKSQTAIQVVSQGAASAPVLADVQADWGFLGNGSNGQAYARNPDGSLNSPQNPVVEGNQVTVYLTGIGAVDPACPEGGTATAAGTLGQLAQYPFMPYASVPGSLCGLFQTNIVVPLYGAIGPAVSLLPHSALTIAVAQRQ